MTTRKKHHMRARREYWRRLFVRWRENPWKDKHARTRALPFGDFPKEAHPVPGHHGVWWVAEDDAQPVLSAKETEALREYWREMQEPIGAALARALMPPA